jgi:hypothetical protein
LQTGAFISGVRGEIKQLDKLAGILFKLIEGEIRVIGVK